MNKTIMLVNIFMEAIHLVEHKKAPTIDSKVTVLAKNLNNVNDTYICVPKWYVDSID